MNSWYKSCLQPNKNLRLVQHETKLADRMVIDNQLGMKEGTSCLCHACNTGTIVGNSNITFVVLTVGSLLSMHYSSSWLSSYNSYLTPRSQLCYKTPFSSGLLIINNRINKLALLYTKDYCYECAIVRRIRCELYQYDKIVSYNSINFKHCILRSGMNCATTNLPCHQM